MKQLRKKFNDGQVKGLMTRIYKKNNFYLSKPKRNIHDREMITNYSGKLIQHDFSHHQFSKYANKWYFISSLNDYRRLIL